MFVPEKIFPSYPVVTWEYPTRLDPPPTLLGFVVHCTSPPSRLLTYLRVRPLGRITEVIFPSGTHVVGRSGTSFSGARAVCAGGHGEPQNRAKAAPRHQDRDAWAIAGSSCVSLTFLSHHVSGSSPAAGTRGGKVKDINQGTSAPPPFPPPTHTH